MSHTSLVAFATKQTLVEAVAELQKERNDALDKIEHLKRELEHIEHEILFKRSQNARTKLWWR